MVLEKAHSVNRLEREIPIDYGVTRRVKKYSCLTVVP